MAMKRNLLFFVFVFNLIWCTAQVNFLNTGVNLKKGIVSLNTSTIDMDSDGDMDILSGLSDDGSGSIGYSWFENQNNGYFTPLLIDSSIISNYSFYGDLDLDGDIDILTTDRIHTYSQDLIWFENDGDQNFSKHSIDTLNTMRLLDAHLIDLDGDGDNDILFSTISNSRIAWYENDNAENFSLNYIDVNSSFGSIFPMDFDGDSDLDFLFNDRSVTDSSIYLYTNDGAQVFEKTTLISNYEYGFPRLVLADLDGDGDEDFVASSYVDELFWFENDGDSSYSKAILMDDTNALSYISVIDLDYDGDADIVSSQKGKVSWFENDGSESFTEHIISNYFDPQSTGEVSVEDLNGDGFLDILVSVYSDSEVYIFENDGNQNFEHLNLTGYSSEVKDVYSVDLDMDGDKDIISASFDNHTILWHENIGFGKYKHHTVAYGVMRVNNLYSEDIDGDGNMDILAVGQYEDHINIFLNDGQENFIVQNLSTEGDFEKVIAKDIDNDGDIDILSCSNGEHKISWFENDGNMNFTEDTLLYVYYSNEYYNSIKDFYPVDMDADGDLDIVYTSYHHNWVNWIENDGNENFTLHIVMTAGDGNSIIVVDVDSDGDLDIVASDPNYDEISWFENDGLQNFTYTNVSYDVAFANDVAARDIDNDGDIDLFCSSPYDNELIWFINDGSQNFTEQIISNEMMGINSFVIDDIDVDGDLDIITANTDDNFIAVFDNSTFNNYLHVNIVPFIDENENGIFDSTDYPFEMGIIGIQPLAYYQSNNNNLSEFYLNAEGDYTFSIALDSSIWNPSDSLERNLTLDTIQFFDTTLFIGISPLQEYLFDTDITGTFPRCGDTILHSVQIQNLGYSIDSGIVQYTLNNSVNFVISDPNPIGILGQQLSYEVNELLSSQTFTIDIKISLPSVIDTISHELLVNLHSGNDSITDTVNFEETILCSYDPNDKQVFPFIGPEGYTLPNDELEYLIRFQNTGNDTAFVVEVIDTLDEAFDINSFSLVSYSHPVVVQINQASREVSFLFENIYLTDTFSNILESQGFVKYSINSANDLSTGEIIENTAHIYFDGNAPITTNTTENTVYNCADLGTSINIGFNTTNFDVSIDEPYLNKAVWTWNGDTIYTGLDGFSYQPESNGVQVLGVHLTNDLCSFDTTYSVAVTGIGIGEYEGTSDIVVYPNPTTGNVGIYFAEVIDEVQVRVLTITGQLISEYIFEANENIDIDLNGASGLYLLEVLDDHNTIRRIKVVKE